MWVDALALALLLGFALLGLWRGALVTGLKLLALIGSYALAALLAPAVAPALSLPVLVAVPLAGAGIFAVAYLAFGVLAWVLRFAERSWRGEGPRTGLDRAGGGLLGLARGGLVVLLLGWLCLWLEALRVAGPLQVLPELGASTVATTTQQVVESALQSTLGEQEPGARLTTRLAAQPAETVRALQRVLENPRIRGLAEDDLFWSYVAHGNPDAALNRASFLGIAYDETLRWQLEDLGLVTEAEAEDARRFRDAVRAVLVELGPRLQALREDPEVQVLLRDPEVQRALESGDTLALVSHEGVQALIRRVSAGEAAAATTN